MKLTIDTAVLISKLPQAKRQSTTKKLSRRDVLAIARRTNALGEGVIVRYKGKEYGVVAVMPHGMLRVYEKSVILNSQFCTIPKSTIETIHHLNEFDRLRISA